MSLSLIGFYKDALRTKTFTLKGLTITMNIIYAQGIYHVHFWNMYILYFSHVKFPSLIFKTTVFLFFSYVSFTFLTIIQRHFYFLPSFCQNKTFHDVIQIPIQKNFDKLSLLNWHTNHKINYKMRKR